MMSLRFMLGDHTAEPTKIYTVYRFMPEVGLRAINWVVLCTQWVVVAFITGGLIYTCGDIKVKPKTQIKIGRWTAIILLILCSLQVLFDSLVVPEAFRIPYPSGLPRIFVYNRLSVILIMVCLLLAGFVFAVVRRLFKTSLFLLIAYFLLIAWDFFTVRYLHPLLLMLLVYHLLVIFLLSQAVIGMHSEKHMAKNNKSLSE